MSDEAGDVIPIPTPDLDGGTEAGLPSDENQAWASKDYDRVSSARQDVARRVHKIASYLIPLGILVAFLAAATLGIVYVLHLVLPADRRWLTPAELQQVHDLLFSAIAGAAVSGMSKAYFAKDPGKKDE